MYTGLRRIPDNHDNDISHVDMCSERYDKQIIRHDKVPFEQLSVIQ